MRILPLKKNGKVFLLLLFILTLNNISYSAPLKAELEDQRISVGESTEITINVYEGENVKPVKVPRVPGLSITYAGMSRSIQIINWKKSESTVFSFSVAAERTGKYIIPAFRFEIDGKVHRSNDLSLIVTKSRTTSGKSSSFTIKPEIIVSKKRIFIGEPLVVRYYLLSSGMKVNVEGFEKLPETKGFAIKQIEESLPDKIEKTNGVDYIKSHISSFILIPTSSGTFKIGGGTAIISYQITRGIFPFTQRKRLIFYSNNIAVQNLPENGKPQEFKGDVGGFNISIDYSKDPLEVYQEKKVIVTLKGSGNFLTITKPVLESEIEGVRILSEDGESKLELKDNKIFGYKKFTYTIIPEVAGEFQLGKFIFSFFNIDKKSYETINSQIISFNVKEGKNAKKGLDFDTNDDNKIEFNPLYVAIILFVVAGFIVFVVVWERKKYAIAVGNDVKSEEPKEDKKDENEYKLNLRKLSISVRRDDKNDFFKLVDKVLNYVKDNSSDFSISDDGLTRIGNIKERLYKYKFGGIQISREEMELIHEEIKEII